MSRMELYLRLYGSAVLAVTYLAAWWGLAKLPSRYDKGTKK